MNKVFHLSKFSNHLKKIIQWTQIPSEYRYIKSTSSFLSFVNSVNSFTEQIGALTLL